MSTRKTCPICLEDFGKKDFSITQCGHKYHTSCLLYNGIF